MTRKKKGSSTTQNGKGSLTRSTWGNVKVVVTKHDRLVYGCIRKKYTRATPYPTHIMRIPPIGREKAAIIKLRKLGYPTNMISRALGRSTSFIHRTLRTAILRLCLRPIDMRKLPSATRLRCSSIRWNTLQKYLPAWEAWLLGEGDKPP